MVSANFPNEELSRLAGLKESLLLWSRVDVCVSVSIITITVNPHSSSSIYSLNSGQCMMH